MVENVGEKAVFITILRDPVEQFISFWQFYGLTQLMNNSLNDWILRYGKSHLKIALHIMKYLQYNEKKTLIEMSI